MKKRDWLKSKARTISYAMRCENLTDNEVASKIRKGKDGFLNSIEWKTLRKKAIEVYGINVDHIKPRKLYPELALNFDNLQILCPRCNKSKGNKYVSDYRHPA